MMSTPRRRSEKAEAGYLITTVDQPKAEIHEERPSRVPVFKIDVLAPTVIGALIAFAGFYSGYIRFWPGAWTAVVAALIFFWRLGLFDVPFSEIKKTVFQNVQVEQRPDPRTVPINQGGQFQREVPLRGGKTLEHGGREFTFEGWQLDRMLFWVTERGIDSIRREPGGDLPGLVEIGINGSSYTTAVYVLEHTGKIHKQGQTYYWTTAGKEWLAEI